MAGIYISGMEMPKDGTMIFAIRQDGMVEDVMGCFVGKAVPVPPHGRLIDADELVLKGYALSVIRYGSYGTWRDDVPLIDTDAAPTIIPAEEKETT